MRKIFIAVLILSFAATLHAEQKFEERKGYLNGPAMIKLKRGALNILTAPGEFPRNIVEEYKDGEGKGVPTRALYTVGGVVKGTAFTIGRMASGLIDVATFNLPWPDNYGPMMKPDFVWDYDEYEE